MLRYSATVAGLALLVAGCAERPADDTGSGPGVLTRADVEVLGTSDALSYVVDLDVLPDGRVWVLDAVEPYFVGFGPDGELLGAHGAEGEGPEEFGRPVGLVTRGLGDEAWVIDAARHALIRISRPDEVWQDIRLPPDSLPPMSLVGGRDISFVRVRAARVAGSVVVPRTMLGERGFRSAWGAIWTADLVAIDPAAATGRTVVSLGEALGDPTPHVPRLGDFPPFPLWFRLFTVCGGSEIRVHDRLSNSIRGFAADGAELPAVPLPAPTMTSVGREDFARALLEAAAMFTAGSLGAVPPSIDTVEHMRFLRSAIDADEADLATLLPRYTDLLCTDGGVIWIRRFDLAEGGLRGGPTWLRIAPDGTTREVVLPPRFDPYRVTDGRIWGVLRDEHDVPSVAWVEPR